MSETKNVLAKLSDEERDELLAQLLAKQEPKDDAVAIMPETEQPEPQRSSYYNMDEAVEVKFRADLTENEKSFDPTWAESYDHIWCIGHYRMRGPKTGVYFVGRGVLGLPQDGQVKGTLRVSSEKFEAFMNDGAELDAWFRPDGEEQATLIGTLSNYRDAL